MTALQSTRPVHAAKIFAGKSADEVLSILPRLFRVCGIAQAGAAVAAMQKALGLDPDGRLTAARNAMILLETAREHLWRISVDWAEFAGLEPDPNQVRALDCLLPEMQSTLFSSDSAFQLDSAPGDAGAAGTGRLASLRQILELTVFGADSARTGCHWRRSHSSINGAGPGKHRPPCSCGRSSTRAGRLSALPRSSHCLTFDDAAIDGRLAAPDADDFVAMPTWNGATCETTVRCNDAARTRWSRRPCSEFGTGLLARVLAVLVELAGIPGSVEDVLADDGWPQATEGSAGYTPVSARSRRRVAASCTGSVVADNIVNEYRILAPTEWNFHPQGALLRGLSTIPADDPERARRMGSALITAVDPCVGFELTVH